jgi:preprotein translocase subunit Sss1
LLSLSSIPDVIQRRIIEIFQTLKLAKKTTKDDYFTYLRLVLLAVAVIGGLGFVFKAVGEILLSK